MGAHGGAMNGERRGGGRPRAVVWTPAASADPRDTGISVGHGRLLESLRKQGADPLEVRSDLWAMAHACVLGSAGPGTLLVLCEPEKLRQPAELVLALRKYAPSVACWTFEPRGEQLRKVTDQDLVDWGAPGRETSRMDPLPPVRAAGKPSLRLTGGEEPRPIGPSLPITEFTASPPSRAADVLSAEELAMLLGRNGSGSAGGGTDGSNGAGSAKGDQR